VFLHIHKCAGSFFGKHAKVNLEKNRLVALNRLNRARHSRAIGRETVNSFLGGFSEEQKDQVKIVMGHAAYYGIHEIFNRPARYVMFIRDPVSRTLSEYNYLRQRVLDTGMRKREFTVRQRTMLDDSGKMLPFEEWFGKTTMMHDYMTKFLCDTLLGKTPGSAGWDSKEGFSGTVGRKDVEAIKDVLRALYFIGIAGHLTEDALFLYHELGFTSFLPGQNVSRKTFVPRDPHKTAELILSKNRGDSEIYEHAVKLNREFKKENEEFHKIARYMKIKRAPSLVRRIILGKINR
jgi:hypothetical protein